MQRALIPESLDPAERPLPAGDRDGNPTPHISDGTGKIPLGQWSNTGDPPAAVSTTTPSLQSYVANAHAAWTSCHVTSAHYKDTITMAGSPCTEEAAG